MDLIDQISKHLRIGKRESEARVAEAHRDGNQIIYGGQRRYDTEHRENVDFYLAGQPEDVIIELTDDMRVLKEGEHLPLEEIERRAKAILAARPVIDYDNSWNAHHCASITCNKMQNGCCMAYSDPTKLAWHRHGEECPTGPYQFSLMSALEKKKTNPLKASKRSSK
jgi:hypothetical protein